MSEINDNRAYIFIIMLFGAFVSFWIFLVLFTYYQCVFKPKRKIEWYRKSFEKLGYRVMVYPFAAFQSSLQNQTKIDEKEKGDPFETIKK